MRIIKHLICLFIVLVCALAFFLTGCSKDRDSGGVFTSKNSSSVPDNSNIENSETPEDNTNSTGTGTGSTGGNSKSNNSKTETTSVQNSTVVSYSIGDNEADVGNLAPPGVDTPQQQLPSSSAASSSTKSVKLDSDGFGPDHR